MTEVSTSSVIMLNVNGLNCNQKAEVGRMNKNTIKLYAMYKRLNLDQRTSGLKVKG